MNVEGEALVIIDHNQAFDPNFSDQEFVGLHAFRSRIDDITGDWLVQKAYEDRFSEVMTEWASICDTVPPAWWFVDTEQTVRTDFNVEEAHRLLMRHQISGFWSMK